MLTLHTHFMHFLRTYNMPGAADADLAVDVTRGHLQARPLLCWSASLLRHSVSCRGSFILI